jgi:hypothetical protein
MDERFKEGYIITTKNMLKYCLRNKLINKKNTNKFY